MELLKPKTSCKTLCFFLNDAMFWQCFWKNIGVDVFDDVLQNAKHRANHASNDVNRPPLHLKGYFQNQKGEWVIHKSHFIKLFLLKIMRNISNHVCKCIGSNRNSFGASIKSSDNSISWNNFLMSSTILFLLFCKCVIIDITDQDILVGQNINVPISHLISNSLKVFLL